MVLNAAPLTDVVISVGSGDTTEATVSAGTLTFTSANWNVAQSVTVTGINDVAVDRSQTTTVTIAVFDASSHDLFDSLADQTVTATTADNDVAGFTVTTSGGSTSVIECGTATITVKVSDGTLSTTKSFTLTVTAAPSTFGLAPLATLFTRDDDWLNL